MNPSDPALELQEVEVLAALLFADQRPLAGAAGLLDWRLDGAVTRLLQRGRISGRHGERLLIRAGAKLRCDWVLLLGAGQRKDCSKPALQALLEDVRRCCQQAQFAQVAVALPLDLQPLAEADQPRAAALRLLFIDDAILA